MFVALLTLRDWQGRIRAKKTTGKLTDPPKTCGAQRNDNCGLLIFCWKSAERM